MIKTQMSAIWRAGKFSLLSLALAVGAFFTIMYGASHANKPHEVKLEELFFGLVAATFIATFFAIHALWKVWKRRAASPVVKLQTRHWVVLVLATTYCLFKLVLLAIWIE